MLNISISQHGARINYTFSSSLYKKQAGQTLYLMEDNIPDIYSKAASILEARRWHALVDGNKRTLLLATKSYPKLNGYLSLFPLRILRYVIGIAGTMSEEQDVTDSVIIQISNWMSKYDAKEDNST